MNDELDDTVVAPPRLPGAPDRVIDDLEDTRVVQSSRVRAQGMPGSRVTWQGLAAPLIETLVEPPPRADRRWDALAPPEGESQGLTREPAASPGPTGWAVESESIPSSRIFEFRIAETVIGLDTAAYIGRRPTAPRIVSGGTVPRLVRVPSPAREVSGTHLEVRQSGTSVVVTDLGSTNGTVVLVPRSQPRKLRQGESVVVTTGTLVDIGDGIVIEILPARQEEVQ